MSTTLTVTKDRIKRLLDERVECNRRHEALLGDLEAREDKTPTDVEQDTLSRYRTRQEEIDAEVKDLGEVLEREEASAKTSKIVRAHLKTDDNGTGGQMVYRTFGQYARDALIARKAEIAGAIAADRGSSIDTVQQAAKERLMLMRAPEHTLSSDIEGLTPPVHIAQIMDVIDASRPIVNSGMRVDLSRGRLTWPKITGRPDAAVQGGEKTGPATTDMNVELEDEQADTLISAGNLSWQAINWSVPNALDLWFRLAGAAYARLAETKAATVLADAADTISDGSLTGDGTDSFADWIAAVLAGVEQVDDDTDRVADTIWLAPDMFFKAAAVVSDSGTMLINAGQLNVKAGTGVLVGLNVVRSKGLDAGQAIVGDSQALLIGETPGTPVELRAVEPNIGGLQVGLIGAFKAISFDDGAFADIGPTT